MSRQNETLARIERFNRRHGGGVSAVYRQGGYTLTVAETGAPVARLKPTGQGDTMRVYYWSGEDTGKIVATAHGRRNNASGSTQGRRDQPWVTNASPASVAASPPRTPELFWRGGFRQTCDFRPTPRRRR